MSVMTITKPHLTDLEAAVVLKCAKWFDENREATTDQVRAATFIAAPRKDCNETAWVVMCSITLESKRTIYVFDVDFDSEWNPKSAVFLSKSTP